MAISFTIGRCDRATQTVTVTFLCGAKTHTRTVNACFTADGKHDRAATVRRVEEVARGVERKMQLGHIG